MREQLAVLIMLLSISAACATSRTSTENAVTPVVTDVPFPDTNSLRALNDAVANVQRVLDDTAAFAALHRALQDSTVLSALFRRIEEQQSSLQRLLQDSEGQRRRFEQLERMQPILEELMRKKRIGNKPPPNTRLKLTARGD